VTILPRCPLTRPSRRLHVTWMTQNRCVRALFMVEWNQLGVAAPRCCAKPVWVGIPGPPEVRLSRPESCWRVVYHSPAGPQRHAPGGQPGAASSSGFILSSRFPAGPVRAGLWPTGATVAPMRPAGRDGAEALGSLCLWPLPRSAPVGTAAGGGEGTGYGNHGAGSGCVRPFSANTRRDLTCLVIL
jgi:hypothetical protein